MKKIFVLITLVCMSILSFAQPNIINVQKLESSNLKHTEYQQFVNVVNMRIDSIILSHQQVVDMLNAHVDSLILAQQQVIEKISIETKDNCTSYYDRLDNEMSRTLTKFTIIWGIIGVCLGVVAPLIINKAYERSLKDDIKELKVFVQQSLRSQDRITASRLREQYKEIDRQIKDQNKTFGRRFSEHKAYIDRVNMQIKEYEEKTQINNMLSTAQNIEKKDKEQALIIYTNVLDIDNSNQDALLGRGIVYLQTQKYEYALADFRKLLSINPNHARAYNNIANVYVENKQLDLAKDNYLKALEIKPNYAIVLSNLALLYSDEIGDYSTALDYCDKAIEIDNNLLSTHKLKIWLYTQLLKSETDENVKDEYHEKIRTEKRIIDNIKDKYITDLIQ